MPAEKPPVPRIRRDRLAAEPMEIRVARASLHREVAAQSESLSRRLGDLERLRMVAIYRAPRLERQRIDFLRQTLDRAAVRFRAEADIFEEDD